jgi:hypothetical protein
VLYNSEASGGIAELVADIGKARTLLGYKPRTQLDAGLRLLLANDPLLRRYAASSGAAQPQVSTPSVLES